METGHRSPQYLRSYTVEAVDPFGLPTSTAMALSMDVMFPSLQHGWELSAVIVTTTPSQMWMVMALLLSWTNSGLLTQCTIVTVPSICGEKAATYIMKSQNDKAHV